LFDKKIDRIFHENEACQRIAKIKGVVPKTATAIVAGELSRDETNPGGKAPAVLELRPVAVCSQ
jgi:transposase